jgi:hypothetical protein
LVGIAPQPPGSLPRSNTWNRGALCSLTARREGKRATRGLRHRAHANARCNRLGRGHRCALGPSGTTRPTAPDGRAAHVALVAFIPMPTVAFAIVRHRAANRLDHVTLTPGATALAVRFMSQKHPSRPGRALNIIHP